MLRSALRMAARTHSLTLGALTEPGAYATGVAATGVAATGSHTACGLDGEGLRTHTIMVILQSYESGFRHFTPHAACGLDERRTVCDF